MKSFSLFLLSSLALSTLPSAFSCDLCGCFSPRLTVTPEKKSSFYSSLAEQFTYFSTDRLNGEKVPNPTGQFLASSNTQLVLGTTFLDQRLGLQLNLPLISRRYQRPEGFEIQRGHLFGIGDTSLLANWMILKHSSPTQNAPTPHPLWTASINLIGGLKFPTGDSSPLAEEFHEVEIEGAPESGIHGHDLALGTGSYDGIFATQCFLGYRSLFFQADLQFTWRGLGSYSYRYANDFSWNGGPGFYLLRKSTQSLALLALLSGETKSTDTFLGQSAPDTGVTSLYLGPTAIASFGRFNAQIGVGLPILMHTTAFQTTPDYRLSASFTLQF
ncbi:MAG: hypothetical protein WCI46_13090 [Verrucomicrobiota bacterium]